MTSVNDLGTMLASEATVNSLNVRFGSGTSNCSLEIASEPASDYTVNLPSSSGTLALSSEIESLPSATQSAQILVADSSFDYQAVDASGDVAVDTSGSFTIQDDAITNSKIADNAINLNKCDFAPATDGNAEASKVVVLDASRDIDNLNQVDAAQMNASTAIQAPIFEVGNSTDRWRMKLNASNNLVLEYSSDSGSTYSVKQIFTNA